VEFSSKRGSFIRNFTLLDLTHKGREDVYSKPYCSRPWRVKARGMSYLEPYCFRPWRIKARERFTWNPTVLDENKKYMKMTKDDTLEGSSQ